MPGTELVLVAPFGSPNGTVEWSVVDQDGVDCWQVGAFERGMRSYECGPVPPGTYRVRCTLSGRTAEGVVRVDGEPQVRVDLGP